MAAQPSQALELELPERAHVSTRTGKRVELVLIAASLGGVSALSRLLGALPALFPVPIAVVQHQQPSASAALLTGVLRKSTRLLVRLAVSGDALRAGTVYIAPPGRNFTVSANRIVELVAGIGLHGLTSAADPLFSSAARAYGSALVAVVLTGTGGDGAAGAKAVRSGGGLVVVQDPMDAKASGMPSATLDACGADWILPLDAIAQRLRTLAGLS